VNKRFALSVFLFRRDLRLVDNRGLNQALQDSARVIPVFCLDPRQTAWHDYHSRPGFAFMQRSLIELDEALHKLGSRLYLFTGQPEDVINKLCGQLPIQAIYHNRDYTPFSLARDDQLATLCKVKGLSCHVIADALLTEPAQVVNKQGLPYRVFTPFWRAAQAFPVARPQDLREGHFFADPLPNAVGDLSKQFPATPPAHPFRQGGREEGVILLKSLNQLQEYLVTRDLPANEQGTTGLSAHLKFGSISVREVFHAVNNLLGEGHPLQRQLYWRDFYTHIGYHFPHVFEGAFLKQYEQLPWNNDKTEFAAWCEGRTGFPIVDAGMQQLLQTGYMHNRARMITASFLVKDLLIDWRWGEKFFARHLTDYDPAVNNGSWQWAASTGTDAQPYFRIFNPWLQQKKFDPEATYIKRWLPELQSLSAKEIHALESARPDNLDYPNPIVSHKQATQETKNIYKHIARQG